MPLDRAPEINAEPKTEEETREAFIGQLLEHSRSILAAVRARNGEADAGSIDQKLEQDIDSVDSFLSKKSDILLWKFTLGDKTTVGLDLKGYTGRSANSITRIALPDGTVYERNERRSGDANLTIDSDLKTISMQTDEGKAWPLFINAPEMLGTTIHLSNHDEELKKQGITTDATVKQLSDGRILRIESVDVSFATATNVLRDLCESSY